MLNIILEGDTASNISVFTNYVIYYTPDINIATQITPQIPHHQRIICTARMAMPIQSICFGFEGGYPIGPFATLITPILQIAQNLSKIIVNLIHKYQLRVWAF